MKRRHLLTTALAASIAAPARAAEPRWPTRPIHLVVAYPPGGISDTLARALARDVAAELGVAVLVDNRAGAGGRIAMEQLARSAPDGLSLCFSAVSPLLDTPTDAGAAVPNDLVARVAPVIGVMLTPVLLVATPALDVRDFPALIAAARAAPDTLRWATSGIGTIGHLVLRQVEMATGVRVVHVPYKGGGQQLTDALGGQFDLLSTNVGALQLEQVAAGHFKPLAIGAPARVAALPAVPTFAELGVPAANVASLFGIFASAGTPAAVLARLNAAFDRALARPQVRRDLQAVGNLVTGGDPAAFARQIERQVQLQQGTFDTPPRR